MTEDLRDLLRDRAEGADLPAPDLVAVIGTGRRRVRRRRGVALGVAALAAVVAGGSMAVVVHRGGGDDAGPASATDQGIPTTGISWATGSTLHVGDQSYDLGHQIVAYVRTSAGYVFSDPTGTVWSASAGTVDQVGTVSAKHPHLVGDANGTLAGWVDASDSQPTIEVLDQSSTTDGTLGFAPAPGTTDEHVVLTAIDGDTVYWSDGTAQSARATFRVTEGYLGPAVSASSGERVLAAADGIRVLAGRGDAISFQLADGSTTTPGPVFGSTAQLSPDGRYANIDADSPAVYDTLTGKQVDLDVDGFFADGYQWLGDHTLAVEALVTKTSDWQLLTCTVPDGACSVAVAHLGNPYDDSGAGGTGFALPIGAVLGD